MFSSEDGRFLEAKRADERAGGFRCFAVLATAVSFDVVMVNENLSLLCSGFVTVERGRPVTVEYSQ